MTGQEPATTDASGTAAAGWAERAAERSPLVQRSRSRTMRQAKRIVDAGRRLVMTQGEFTTQELVKEAGVALQTFYRHFGSKDALLLAVIEESISEQMARAEELARYLPDPVARLRFYITSLLQTLGDPEGAAGARQITAEHWRLYQEFPNEITDAARPFVDLLRRELLAAEEAGLVTPNDPEQDAWLMVELVRSVFHHYAFAKVDRPPEQIAEHVWSFCFRAVGGRPDTDS